MEARKIRAVALAAGLVVLMGATYRTPNFVVETPDPAQARQYAETSERLRRELAESWLGKAMPRWASPCTMRVRVGPHLGAGGATTFIFDRGEVYGWRMTIQGSHERLLDSVLPHEITHMILATHFRCPLPRWADEGAATSVEHVSERTRHRRMLVKFLQTGRGLPFNRMYALREYPRDVMPLYAQGFSLAEYLIAKGGRRKFIDYLGEGLKTNDWATATRRYYDIQDLGRLQQQWLAWVAGGFRDLRQPETQPERGPAAGMLAGQEKRPRPEPNLIYHIKPKQAASGPAVAAREAGGTTDTVRATGSGPAESETKGHGSDSVRNQPGRQQVVAPQMARPQPFERSRQIILQWER
jgi:hypothetical protein